MMKKLFAAAGVSALFALLPGCTHTRVPSQPVSPEEQAWEDIIRDNYPGYRPPPTTSRSFQGHTESRASAKIRTPLKPADDPAGEVKSAEAKSEAPAAEAKSEAPADEAKSEAPADEAKPAEAKSEAPADEAKPAEAKSEAPADEAKPAETKSEAKPVEAKPENAANGNQAPPDPTGSTVYEVKSGDTLGSIARKAYGDARYSNVIFKANTDILKSPDKLTPGMKIIVPKL